MDELMFQRMRQEFGAVHDHQKGLGANRETCERFGLAAAFRIYDSALQQSHGLQLIAAERKRQIEVEGWTPAHDNDHKEGEMAIAAACYASPVPIRAEMGIPCGCREASCHHAFGRIGTEWRNLWPWEESQWKPSGDPIRNLVKAGALIAAEIDRLARAAIAEATPEGAKQQPCDTTARDSSLSQGR